MDNNKVPKPLFGASTPSAKVGQIVKDDIKAANALLNQLYGVSQHSRNTPAVNTGPKELFRELAVSENVIDPILASNPLCAGMSKKDIARIKQMINQADVSDVKYTINYADAISSNFVQLVDQIMQQSTSGKLNDVKFKITDMLASMNKMTATLNLFSQAEQSASSWISRTFNDMPSVNEVVKDFSTNLKKVDTTVVELLSDIDSLLTYDQSLESMLASNKDNFDVLNLHVVAGKLIINEYTEKLIPAKQANIKHDDPFAQQDLGFLKSSVDRFSRKVLELEKLQRDVLANATRIRNMQTSNILLAQNIKYAAQYLVPSWKTLCADLITFLQNLGSDTMYQLIKSPLYVAKQQSIQQLVQKQTELEQSFK